MDQTTLCLQEEKIPPDSLHGVVAALSLLRESRRFADTTGSERWTFAVEMHCLLAAGSSVNVLRWLAKAGWVEHKVEMTTPKATKRRFQASGSLSFDARSCFVLTDHGLPLALELVPTDKTHSSRIIGATRSDEQQILRQPGKPRWERKARQLWVGPVLVKEFRVPADNQEAVLTAFQMTRWRRRISDPLPQSFNPVKTLQDASNRLNHRQRVELLRFHTTEHGTAVWWELLQ